MISWRKWKMRSWMSWWQCWGRGSLWGCILRRAWCRRSWQLFGMASILAELDWCREISCFWLFCASSSHSGDSSNINMGGHLRDRRIEMSGRGKDLWARPWRRLALRFRMWWSSGHSRYCNTSCATDKNCTGASPWDSDASWKRLTSLEIWWWGK